MTTEGIAKGSLSCSASLENNQLQVEKKCGDA